MEGWHLARRHIRRGSTLWCFARRLVPLHVLKDKLDGYIAEGHIAAHEKDCYVQLFEQMLGVHRESNLHGHPLRMVLRQ